MTIKTLEFKGKANDLPGHIDQLKKITKAVIWRGPSPADGKPIMAVISGMNGTSDNDKTGRMAQVDILREDLNPFEAIKLGLENSHTGDYSICGNCSLRPHINPDTGKVERICYVNILFGPNGKFKAVNRGSYQELTPAQAGLICRHYGVGIRHGAYADPAMVPVWVWAELQQFAGTFHTSYTHQWLEPWFDPAILRFAMASIDKVNTVEKLRAKWPGARYYRMADNYDNLTPDEIKCPSNPDSRDENGQRNITCSRCKLCNGNTIKAKNIVIIENE